jgi:hypothetical protein
MGGGRLLRGCGPMPPSAARVGGVPSLTGAPARRY